MSWKNWLVVLVLLGLIWLWQQWPDGRLHLVFCDVGQGDAALVVLGAFQALIDTGPSFEKLSECLSREIPFWDRRVELVFISHPQKDHNGALEELEKRYRIGRLVESSDGNEIYRYKDLYFDVLNLVKNDGDVTRNKGTLENEDSMVLSVSYRGFSSLFTADIGEETELALLKRGVLKKTSVLKVPHHGSKFSSSEPFLSRLRPSLAVISVGAKNSYGHPSADTLMRLEGVGTRILRTDQRGSVEVVYDGKGSRVYTQK